MAGHPQAAKLTLTEHLPRGPGVYLFRDRVGRILYVGKAANLRARVRSYFSTDQRRKVAQLLREVDQIDHLPCANGLEAAVREIRLIHEHLPRFNRQGTRTSRYRYAKLTVERFPRLAIVRRVGSDGGLHLGPFPSHRAARSVVDAVHDATMLRRCTDRPGATSRAPCGPAQLGVAACPCSGQTGEAEYRAIVSTVRQGLTDRPDLLLSPLTERMERLAGDERFEEAAAARDRAQALVGRPRPGPPFRPCCAAAAASCCRSTRGRSWSSTAAAWSGSTRRAGTGPGSTSCPFEGGDAGPPSGVEADELLCVASWLDRNAHRLRVLHADGRYACRSAPLPDFTARPARVASG